ncbi:hypothetical protein O6H91_01G020700 [Diphasiastrum complanatum]|uniref:Uncharacterized protein n=1 Tax=Diphasiastrum complanatum TaxID=34168 RepID=A0ACC2EP08_DIPCM|nr:hypothetical protein O6H91_01G020700 [Diphasiastrum complanatum]
MIQEDVSHRYIQTNGITMHIAEQGSELWYSWRHQIPALARAGYHVIAPDLRGYGETESPMGSENYTALDIVGDIIGLLDALKVRQAFVVGHDWGAIIAWHLCLFRQDRVRAIVALSVPFTPRRPEGSEFKYAGSVYGEGYYVRRFQEPGRAEADFGRFTAKTVLKKFILLQNYNAICAPTNKEILDILEVPKTLPPWVTEEDFDYMGLQFQRSGFIGPLNYYRATELSWRLTAPWAKQSIRIPALYIGGEQDVVYHSPGVKKYVLTGGMQKHVPHLHVVVLASGHFMHEEKPNEVNEHLMNFFASLPSKL